MSNSSLFILSNKWEEFKWIRLSRNQVFQSLFRSYLHKAYTKINRFPHTEQWNSFTIYCMDSSKNEFKIHKDTRHYNNSTFFDERWFVKAMNSKYKRSRIYHICDIDKSRKFIRYNICKKGKCIDCEAKVPDAIKILTELNFLKNKNSL